MEIFGVREDTMKNAQAVYTLREIMQQPATWRKTYAQIRESREKLERFLSPILSQPDFDIVLTGAGSSEFIGNALFRSLERKYGYRVKSYGSTDIVPAPESHLSREKPTLLVSFGRSGNSPESIGAVDAADTVCRNLRHLFITCNADGMLSRRVAGRENCFALNLTPETHDQAFAMTSSFSNMYLAAYLALNLDQVDVLGGNIEDVCKTAEDFLAEGWHDAARIVESFPFRRIVYLGNTALKGIAQESALKMLELSAGRVETMHDSPLGFRHGPKSIIDNDTLVVAYLSDDPYQRKYELDLLKEMGAQRKKNRIAAVCNTPCPEAEPHVDYLVSIGGGAPQENVLLGLAYLPFAQTLAALKSLSLGITPDNPCPTGEVNRVVTGVTLYPYTLEGAQ